MDELGDIVQEFLVESHENLDQLDRDLVALEQTPGSRPLLSSIFRTIHTIKGTSGFLAFNRLERVTHVGESLLVRLRDGAQVMTPEATDALLRMVDTVRALLTAVEERRTDEGPDIDGVIEQVMRCIREGPVPDANPPAPAVQPPAGPDAPAAGSDASAAGTAGGPAGGDATVAPPAPAGTASSSAAEPGSSPNAASLPAGAPAGSPQSGSGQGFGVPASAAGSPAVPAEGIAAARTGGPQRTPGGPSTPAGGGSPVPAAASAQPGAAGTPAPTGASASAASATGHGKGSPLPQRPTSATSPPGEPVAFEASESGEGGRGENSFEELFGMVARRNIADSSIRVDVDLLDALMRLVGELVLTRNQLVRAISETTDAGMSRTAQRLNLITSELQEGVMKTRMQAIDHLWAKLPRVVRDLSSACGKQVRLAMDGRETELDRSLLEAVKDPLTHLVRNAVDHGVERPDFRVACGKPAEGTLTLRAYHEGGHVIVEVADDGAGMDPERISRAAVERGLATRDQLTHMDRREILAMVFRPGFSTSKTVTKISGRGVGMDVVKTNIERIGGAVDVDSTVGKGTTWRLTIPLTLAIIQALTVECAGERYVIPQVAVHELVYLDGQSGRVIENAMGAPVYRLRGNLLPLVRLEQALGLADNLPDQDVYVAVLQAEGRRFGLVVDRVLNTEEVVVKPLTSRFKDIGVYAGATILGDGRVALILDVASLARRSHLNVGAADRAEQAVESSVRATSQAVSRLLIAGIGDRRVAIPLDRVARLEEFPVDRIERVGQREVVQYREQILPVVRLSNLLGAYETETGESVPVVVYTERGRSVALAVERIVDIVEEELDVRRDFGDDGLLGSAVIQQRVTELLDVRRAILAADPMFEAGDDGTAERIREAGFGGGMSLEKHLRQDDSAMVGARA